MRNKYRLHIPGRIFSHRSSKTNIEMQLWTSYFIPHIIILSVLPNVYSQREYTSDACHGVSGLQETNNQLVCIEGYIISIIQVKYYQSPKSVSCGSEISAPGCSCTHTVGQCSTVSSNDLIEMQNECNNKRRCASYAGSHREFTWEPSCTMGLTVSNIRSVQYTCLQQNDPNSRSNRPTPLTVTSTLSKSTSPPLGETSNSDKMNNFTPESEMANSNKKNSSTPEKERTNSDKRNSSTPEREKTNDVGAIVGGVVGGLVGLTLIILTLLLLNRYKSKKKEQARVPPGGVTETSDRVDDVAVELETSEGQYSEIYQLQTEFDNRSELYSKVNKVSRTGDFEPDLLKTHNIGLSMSNDYPTNIGLSGSVLEGSDTFPVQVDGSKDMAYHTLESTYNSIPVYSNTSIVTSSTEKNGQAYDYDHLKRWTPATNDS